MTIFVELTVLLATLVGLMLGAWSIYWVRVRPCVHRAKWGRRLFVVTLLILGGIAFLAAVAHADGLAPLGLLSGLLIVGMLWESPLTALPDETLP